MMREEPRIVYIEREREAPRDDDDSEEVARLEKQNQLLEEQNEKLQVVIELLATQVGKTEEQTNVIIASSSNEIQTLKQMSGSARSR